MIKPWNIIKTASLIIKYGRALSNKKDFFKDINQSFLYRPVVKVQDFLNNLALDYRASSSTFRIRQCLFCTKPHYNQQSNLYTLNVNKNNGIFYCHRCASKGSWSQLQAKYLNMQANQIGYLMSNEFNQNTVKIQQLPINQAQYFLYTNNLTKPQYEDVLKYVKSKGLTEQTIKKFMIGAGTQTFISAQGKPKDVKCVYFPMFNLNHKINKKSSLQKQKQTNNQKQLQAKLVKFKIRGASDQNQIYSRQFPIGPNYGFFGLNTIFEKDNIIVITENQFDAMAVNQQTGYSAISLPQGSHTIHEQLIPLLNQFEKIVLWLDNDEAGRLGQDKICYKLGSSRTFIVRVDDSSLRNANDVLLNCPARMNQFIQKSRTKPGQNIILFQDIRQSIRNRICKYQQYIGVKIDWLPFFNKKVKGIRMQQVSIVSGPTGCGKTTFLSQLSLDLCKKQIPVLWGSFQIKNEILVTNMLIQYAGLNLFSNKQMFEYYSEQFKKLPLYYLDFSETKDVDKVLAAIQYSIQKNNVSFVVLDTLQFLLSDQAEGYKKFDLQDKVLSRLRKIATNFNVHIAIVIHPRKVQDNEDIQISSIYGTSKATQESDNIWILQNRQNFRVVDVKKNRFDGDIGKAALGFNKLTKSYFQLTKSQISGLFNSQFSIEDIIQKRFQNVNSPPLSQQQQQKQQNISEQDLNESKRKRRQ